MNQLIEKAKPIKLLILDVDGVLTNGTLYYGPGVAHLKGFHIQDGLGIKLLQKTGVTVAIITAKQSEAVALRASELHITHIYMGRENKLPAYEELKHKLDLNDQQIAYMGDDLPDLPCLRRAGLAISVPNSSETLSQHVDFITTKKAGKGAVREACELIMKAQNSYEAVIQSYLTE